jgi:hypothetical protein
MGRGVTSLPCGDVFSGFRDYLLRSDQDVI